MFDEKRIWIGSAGDKKSYLFSKMANRHGLIAGASGTGKTVTLKVLIEAFSERGVPVFVADVKGDIAGLAKPGNQEKMGQRALTKFNDGNFTVDGFPICVWDVFGEKGLPLRTTIEDMGPVLLSRLMELSDIQSDVLNIVFHIAEDNKVEINTIEDLRKLITYINKAKDDYVAKYGNMSTQSLGAIQRSLLALQDLGGDKFFGLPGLDISDWFDNDGLVDVNEKKFGLIHVLHSVELAHNPTLYGTFLLWMLTKLFEKLPEEGDLEKPKFVFFFDEAHMLFTDAPKALVTKVEQVVKLIRSKGVGIYFISQSPSDIPDKVLSQLSNRIQHGLRAYTPAEQKAVKAAAQAFRANPGFKTEEAILDLGIGEAVVSCLDEEGRPSIVERAFIVPPRSRLGPLSDEEYDEVMEASYLDYLKEKCDPSEMTRKEKEAIRKNEDRLDDLLESVEEEEPPAKKTSTSSTRTTSKTTSKSTASKAKTSSSRSSSTKTAAKKTAGRAAGRAVGNAASVIGREAGKGLISLFKKK